MARSTRYVVSLRGRELVVELTPLGDGRLTAHIEGSSAPPFEVSFFGDGSDTVLGVDRHVLELFPSGDDLVAAGERSPLSVESSARKKPLLEAPQKIRAGTVRAPMPGRVVKVLVEPGAPVEKGTSVIVVEAMKMENELTAGAAGVVKRVLVKAGDAVERGALLVEIA